MFIAGAELLAKVSIQDCVNEFLDSELTSRKYYSRSQKTIMEPNRTIHELSNALKQANKKLQELGISTILDGAHVHDSGQKKI